MSRKSRMALIPITLALAALVHVVAVWSVPVVITSIFMSRVVGQAGTNHVVAGPLPTDTSRSVVKPSPDLLYAACIYDVSAGAVRVSIDPPPGYWSLSLFGRNTDNFFKLGAADGARQHAEIVLADTASAEAARTAAPGASIVAVPGARGVMLARILVLDPAHMERERAAQGSVRCEPVGKRS